jgi:hypothetical protein
MNSSYATPPNPQSPNSQLPWWKQRRFVVTLFTIVIGASVLVVALVVILLRGGPEVAADASATRSPTASASVASPSVTIEPTAATPEPTPKPDRFASLSAGWNRVLTSVNLRSGPSTEASAIRLIGTAELLWIMGDNARADGHLWYSAWTANGESGWVVSGPGDDPYLDRVSKDERYERCGPVSHDGERIDGVNIGYHDDVQLATLQLIEMHGDEACITFDASHEYVSRFLNMEAAGCGSPSFGSGGSFPLRPTDEGNPMGMDRVEERFPVPGSFFEEGATSLDGELYNRWVIFLLARRSTQPLACTSFAIHDGGDGIQRAIAAWVENCFIVTDEGRGYVRISTADGDTQFRLFKPRRHSLDLPPIGQAAMLRIGDVTEDWDERLVISNRGSC